MAAPNSLTPIELAIADVERWTEALDRERDRASQLLGLLKGVRQESPLLFRERPRRVLPPLVLEMATAVKALGKRKTRRA